MTQKEDCFASLSANETRHGLIYDVWNFYEAWIRIVIELKKICFIAHYGEL